MASFDDDGTFLIPEDTIELVTPTETETPNTTDSFDDCTLGWEADDGGHDNLSLGLDEVGCHGYEPMQGFSVVTPEDQGPVAPPGDSYSEAAPQDEIENHIEALVVTDDAYVSDDVDADITHDVAIPEATPRPSIEVPLEEGKEYHFFLAHSTEDKEYVEELLETIEAEPYKLKCCYSRRDFTPGVDILINIEQHITKAHSIVLILTHAFMQSEYCKMERRLAENMQCAGENNLIPILLEDCPEALSNSLRVLNYIDARQARHDQQVFGEVVDKLVRALMHGLDNTETLPLMVTTVASAPPDRNGNKMSVRAETGTALARSRFSSVFVDLKAEEKRKVETMGLQLTEQLVDQLFTVVNTTGMLRHHKLLFKKTGWLFIMLVLTILVLTPLTGFGSLVMLAMRLDDTMIPASLVLIVFVVIIVAVIASLVVIFVFRRRFQRQAKKLMEYSSQLLQCNHKVVADLLSDSHGIFLILTKLDTGLCQAYIRDNLLKPPTGPAEEGEEEEDLQFDQEFIDQQCARVIFDSIPGYMSILQQGYQQASVQRHPVMGNLICMCQYVEINKLHIARPPRACEIECEELPRRRRINHQDENRQPLVV